MRERNSDAGAQADPLRVLGRDDQRKEGVVSGRFRRGDAVETQVLQAPCRRSQALEPQGLGCASEAVALDQRDTDSRRILV